MIPVERSGGGNDVRRENPVLDYAKPISRRLTLWNDPKRSGTLIVCVLLGMAVGIGLLFLMFFRAE